MANLSCQLSCEYQITLLYSPTDAAPHFLYKLTPSFPFMCRDLPKWITYFFLLKEKNKTKQNKTFHKQHWITNWAHSDSFPLHFHPSVSLSRSIPTGFPSACSPSIGWPTCYDMHLWRGVMIIRPYRLMKTTTSFIEAARWNIDNYQLQSLRQRRGRLKALKNKFKF